MHLWEQGSGAGVNTIYMEPFTFFESWFHLNDSVDDSVIVLVFAIGLFPFISLFV